MVQEIRQIILGVDELVAAIEGYRRITPHFLPSGKITRCAVSAVDVVTVGIEITRDGFTRVTEFALNNTDLLRPLVSFCLQSGIPLPKDGRKAVMVGESGVALCVTRNVGVEIPAWIAPMRLDQIKSVTALSPADINLEKTAVKAGR